jgi:hypothetical protein
MLARRINRFVMFPQVFQIVVIVYKTAGMAGMALALILPVSRCNFAVHFLLLDSLYSLLFDLFWFAICLNLVLKSCQRLRHVRRVSKFVVPEWHDAATAASLGHSVISRQSLIYFCLVTRFCSYHTMSLPVSVTLGIWGLQRSNRNELCVINHSVFRILSLIADFACLSHFFRCRLAPAVLIVAATATIARIRSAFRRRVRRSKANGVLRYMTRCFRYIRRGAGAAAGKMKKGRVFPSDATSIQISPSMKG